MGAGVNLAERKNMKVKEFKVLLHDVTVCADDSPVWWCGYLFMDFTEKQYRELLQVLVNRFGIRFDKMGNPAVIVPSGLSFRIK